jgi:crossover junction endodeoxyribonuclease RuvC
MSKYNIIIAVDPGLTGGISILDGKSLPTIHKMPVSEIITNKKKKKIYDLDAIAEILSPYKGKDVLFVQELVSAMPNQGVTSSFNFGFSSGATLGVAAGLGFDRYEVRPAIWKKHFKELTTQTIIDLKEKAKEIRSLSKTIKDKEQKKENKKELEKINRQVKTEAKDASRELVSKKYPKLSHLFKKKNTDGLAESLLIGIFGMETQDELI